MKSVREIPRSRGPAGRNVERLETRCHLDAVVTNQVLVITGTGEKDYITIRSSVSRPLAIDVRLNDLTQNFAVATFKAIDVRAGGGTDVITIDDLQATALRISIDAGGGNDVITGSPAGESIKAGAGNDVIRAGRGNDTINGGDGDDTIECDVGKDSADGGAGNDRIFGARGNDTLRGGAGDDILNGEEDADRVFGDDGSDRMQDSRGAASMYGGAGDDHIAFVVEKFGEGQGGVGEGGEGRDSVLVTAEFLIQPWSSSYKKPYFGVKISGGPGDDTLAGDAVRGDEGNDVITAFAVNDAHIYGGPGDDQITCDTVDPATTLEGEDGNDVIRSNKGQLIGGAGNDRLFTTGDRKPTSSPVASTDRGFQPPFLQGGDGDDALYGNSSPERFSGGAGDDTLYGSYGNDTVNGDAGDDLLNSEGDDDSVMGDAGNDTIFGGNGSDNLFGGDGLDRLYGGGDSKDQTRSDDGIDFGDTGKQKGDWRDPGHPWRATAYFSPPNSVRSRPSGLEITDIGSPYWWN